MRFVVWNCFGKTPAAALRHLAQFEPDVVVAPELRPLGEELSTGVTCVWDPVLPNKGLGVIGQHAWSVRRSPEAARVPWVLPVEVNGPRSFTLLALWTVRGSIRKLSYSKQVAEAIDAYVDELGSGRCVIAGDFNCSMQGVSPSPVQHVRNVEKLVSLGLVNAYHAHRGVAMEVEEPGTLYFQWKRDRPFHCDFAFIPVDWTPDLTNVSIGSHDDWVEQRISDHVPVVIDLADPDRQ